MIPLMALTHSHFVDADDGDDAFLNCLREFVSTGRSWCPPLEKTRWTRRTAHPNFHSWSLFSAADFVVVVVVVAAVVVVIVVSVAFVYVVVAASIVSRIAPNMKRDIPHPLDVVAAELTLGKWQAVISQWY
jgi:peptidoglycan/LPS O-acetylase OafA/YrhL